MHKFYGRLVEFAVALVFAATGLACIAGAAHPDGRIAGAVLLIAGTVWLITLALRCVGRGP